MDRINTYNLFKFIRTIALLQIFVLSLVLGISMDMKDIFNHFSHLKLGTVYQPLALVEIDNNSATNLLKHVNIVMAGKETEVIAASSYFNTIPEGLLTANIKALEQQPRVSRQGSNIPPERIELPAIKREDEAVNIKHDFGQQLVMLYCTHNAECYIPDSGEARVDGKHGLINKVAENLAKELGKRGLNAEFDDTIHDYPIYNASYTNSKETIKKFLKEKQNIIAMFDIHRDSIPGSNSAETIEVKGKKSARILIIVGTDERKPHPDWQENLAFAQKLYDEAEILYPGLIKAVRTKAGTYNQEFHPKALLLEFGNDRNSLAEVGYAAELFADILVEVLKKEVD